MWRNLRHLGAWISNADVYEDTACPIFELSYSGRPVLGPLEYFKKALRAWCVSPGEEIFNCVHAPDSSYEENMLRAIVLLGAELPSVSSKELREIASSLKAKTATADECDAFYSVNCLLEDEPTKHMDDPVLGLCRVVVDGVGKVLTWESASGLLGASEIGTRPSIFWSTYRTLYDATFVGGDPVAFLRCLQFYEREFIKGCYRLFAGVPVEAREYECETLDLLNLLVPPSLRPGRLASVEIEAARHVLAARLK
jgi:hypothetical protein